MCYGFVFALLFASVAAQADTFTCRTPSGQIVYSDLPCAKGEIIDRISPSESVPDPEAAQRELARQKAYADKQAAENAKARAATPGVAILPDRSSPPPTWPAPTPVSPSSSISGSVPPTVSH